MGVINESLNARLATESRSEDFVAGIGALVGGDGEGEGDDVSPGAGGKADVGAGRGGGAIDNRCEDDLEWPPSPDT